MTSRRSQPADVDVDGLLALVDAALDALPKDVAPIAGFDADHTLWRGDIGDDAFLAAPAAGMLDAATLAGPFTAWLARVGLAPPLRQSHGAGASSFLPDAGAAPSLSLLDAGAASSLLDAGAAPPLPDGAASSVTDAGTAPSVTDAGTAPSLPDAGEPSSLPDAGAPSFRPDAAATMVAMRAAAASVDAARAAAAMRVVVDAIASGRLVELAAARGVARDDAIADAYAMQAWIYAPATAAAIESWAARLFADGYAARIFPGAARLIAGLRGRGVDVVVVSASHHALVRPGAALLGIAPDAVYGTTPDCDADGRSLPAARALYGDAKRDALRARGGGKRPLLALGDSVTTTDRAMLEDAHLPVAVEPRAAHEAAARAWGRGAILRYRS